MSFERHDHEMDYPRNFRQFMAREGDFRRTRDFKRLVLCGSVTSRPCFELFPNGSESLILKVDKVACHNIAILETAQSGDVRLATT